MASFSPISTDWLCLQHTQMPRTQDLVIQVRADDNDNDNVTTDGQTDCFTPCTCARGNNRETHAHPIWVWPARNHEA